MVYIHTKENNQDFNYSFFDLSFRDIPNLHEKRKEKEGRERKRGEV